MTLSPKQVNYKLEKTNKINTADLESGVYLLTIILGNGQIETEKIVKY